MIASALRMLDVLASLAGIFNPVLWVDGRHPGLSRAAGIADMWVRRCVVPAYRVAEVFDMELQREEYRMCALAHGATRVRSVTCDKN